MSASYLRISLRREGGNAPGTELGAVVHQVWAINTGLIHSNGLVTPITLDSAAIRSANTYAKLVAAVDAAIDATPLAADLSASLAPDGVTLLIADLKARVFVVDGGGAGIAINQLANVPTQADFSYLPSTAPPAYALTSDAARIDEGATVTITLWTTNLPAGAQFRYFVYGTGITSGDFSNGRISGVFTVGTDGKALLQVPTAADRQTEGNEFLTVGVEGLSASVTVSINDSSREMIGLAGVPTANGVVYSSTSQSERVIGISAMDVVKYGLRAQDVQVSRIGLQEWQVVTRSTSDSVDYLSDVERLQFNDGSMALDLEGTAGTAIRLLAALLGPGALSQPALTGIAIGLFDSGLNAPYIARMGLEAVGIATASDLIAALRANLSGAEAERPAASTLQGMLASGMTFEEVALWAAGQPALSTTIDFSALRERGIKYLPYAPPAVPDYRVTAGSDAISEGETATFSIVASRGHAGASVAYSLDGVSATDVVGSALSGHVQLSAGGQGSLRVPIAVDQATEGAETLVVNVAGTTATTRIADTSTTPGPRFELAARAESVDEGQFADFVLRTEGVAPGTVVHYTIGGDGIDESDLFMGPLGGEAVVGADTTALIRVGLQADGATEGPESLVVSYGGAQASMWVNDISIGLVGAGGQGNDGGTAGGGGDGDGGGDGAAGDWG